jgi:tetratricopeptide (TPR) repeat protein
MSAPKPAGPRRRDAARKKLRVLNRLALRHRRAGRHEDAVEALLQALELARDVLEPGDPGIAILMGNLAGTYQALGKLRKSEVFYRRALRLLEQALGACHPDVARTQLELSDLYRRWGDPLAARELAERSLATLRQALGNDAPDLLPGLHRLARLYADGGHLAEAKPLLLEAHQILHRRPERRDDPELALCLANLAGLYHAAGSFSHACALYRRLLRHLRLRYGDRHPAVVEVLTALADLYRSCGRNRRAKILDRHASSMRTRMNNPLPAVST